MSGGRLILFAGLPGVGKTTLARALSGQLGAVYLRIDTIEEGLRRSHVDFTDLKDAGYTVAQAVAADALLAGQTVVADAVHGHRQGWDDWEALAHRVPVDIDWIRLVCSDEAEHQARIKRRAAAGAKHGADWTAIRSRQYDEWPASWPMIDTAGRDLDACLSEICARLELS